MRKISSTALKRYLRQSGFNLNCPKCGKVLKFESHKRHEVNYRAEVWCTCGEYAGMFIPEAFIQYDPQKTRLVFLKNMDYLLYLLTPEWNEKRKRLIALANYTCQWCNAQNTVLQLHHLTYAHRGDEPDEDLIVLCKDCHEKHHNITEKAR